MWRQLNYISILCLSLVLWACTNTKQHSIKANLTGHIADFKFNTMPMKGKQASKGIPLKTALYIFEETSLNQVDSLSGSFCSNVNTRLITKTISDSLGNFHVNLKPGSYSAFVSYEGAYYIPYFSGSNWIALFEIKANEITILDINVYGNSNYQ